MIPWRGSGVYPWVVALLRRLGRWMLRPLGVAWVLLLAGTGMGVWYLEGLSWLNGGHWRSSPVRWHPDPVDMVLDDFAPVEELVPGQPEGDGQKESAADSTGAEAGGEARRSEEPVSVLPGEPEGDAGGEAWPAEDLSGLKAPLDPGVLAHTPWGWLPVRGEKGECCWKVFGQPVASGSRPRVALVIQVPGHDARGVLERLDALPGPLTFALSPWMEGLSGLVDALRCKGHEVLLALPMAPEAKNRSPEEHDPGEDPAAPLALVAGATAEANIHKLYRALGRGVGYVGVMPVTGQHFMKSRDDLAPVLKDLAGRGLLFADLRPVTGSAVPVLAPGCGLPLVSGDVDLNGDFLPEQIREAFDLLGKKAVEQGMATGVVLAFPGVLDQVVAWAGSPAGQKIRFVPVSAVACIPGEKPVD
jgi:polysaccharide deacetylase 2 family uncharacterized protein YibQ